MVFSALSVSFKRTFDASLSVYFLIFMTLPSLGSLKAAYSKEPQLPGTPFQLTISDDVDS